MAQIAVSMLIEHFALSGIKCSSTPQIMNLIFMFPGGRDCPPHGSYIMKSKESVGVKDLGTINFGMSVISKGKY